MTKQTTSPVKYANIRQDTHRKVTKLGRLLGQKQIDILAQAIDQMYERNQKENHDKTT